MENSSPENKEIGLLDRITYALRKQTLREELPEFEAEKDFFRRAETAAVGEGLALDRILVVASESRAGRKALSSAIELAKLRGSELVIAFYTKESREKIGTLPLYSIRNRIIESPMSATGDIVFLIRKEKVDLVIVPDKFSDSFSGKTSEVTRQVACESGLPSVLVVRG